jgi:hypothetical protein
VVRTRRKIPDAVLHTAIAVSLCSSQMTMTYEVIAREAKQSRHGANCYGPTTKAGVRPDLVPVALATALRLDPTGRSRVCAQ